MLSIEEGNMYIKDAIEKGIPFIAGKMGAVEQQVMMSYLKRRPLQTIFDDGLRWHASNHAGITPPNNSTLNFFVKLYIESLKNTDLLTIWFSDSKRELSMSSILCRNAKFVNGLQALEPFYHSDPWSSVLEGKKVLVVHPFEESIKEQYSKRHLLFDDKKILPDFELITFKTYQTHGGGNTDHDWTYCYNDMVSRINDIDFDVALVGCGAYGLPICSHIKNMGKPAIHVGGGLQIMFGIKGNRWDQMDAVNIYYNEHWKRPYDSEKTRNHQVVEGSTYW
jgi:hypothetical protein